MRDGGWWRWGTGFFLFGGGGGGGGVSSCGGSDTFGVGEGGGV